MEKFKELDIGDVFRTNLTYFQKTEVQERTEKCVRRIRVNARFLSDDDYESEKTDIYTATSPVWIDPLREVEPVDGDTLRAVKQEKTNLN